MLIFHCLVTRECFSDVSQLLMISLESMLELPEHQGEAAAKGGGPRRRRSGIHKNVSRNCSNCAQQHAIVILWSCRINSNKFLGVHHNLGTCTFIEGAFRRSLIVMGHFFLGGGGGINVCN